MRGFSLYLPRKRWISSSSNCKNGIGPWMSMLQNFWDSASLRPTWWPKRRIGLQISAGPKDGYPDASHTPTAEDVLSSPHDVERRLEKKNRVCRISQWSDHSNIWIEETQSDPFEPRWPNVHPASLSADNMRVLQDARTHSMQLSNGKLIVFNMWTQRSFDRWLSVQEDREWRTSITSTSSTARKEKPRTYWQGSSTFSQQHAFNQAQRGARVGASRGSCQSYNLTAEDPWHQTKTK